MIATAVLLVLFALVTGGARRIGAVLARTFAAVGVVRASTHPTVTL